MDLGTDRVFMRDGEEFLRRGFHVARGLGLERPPEGLFYLKLNAPLTERNECIGPAILNG